MEKSAFLPVLDDLLADTVTAGKVNLGVIEIPMEKIVGTRSEGRTNVFVTNFMPLLHEDSEFATKWRTLYISMTVGDLRHCR